MEYIQYLIILAVAICIAVAIIRANSKNYKIEINKLVSSLGGKDNIEDYEFNKSRFVVNLKDISKVNKESIQKMGAKGIVEIENQLKIIVGEEGYQLKKQIDNLMKK